VDHSGILCRPPLDPSAGVYFDNQKVESSIPPDEHHPLVEISNDKKLGRSFHTTGELR
jgi:hypothetical protein